MLPRNVRRAFGLMLLLLAGALIGCATPSAPQVVTCPAVPAMPSVSPLPKEGYSLRVQRNISEWEKALTSTPPMSKP